MGWQELLPILLGSGIFGGLSSVIVGWISAGPARKNAQEVAKKAAGELYADLCKDQNLIISQLRERIWNNETELQKLRLELVGVRAENEELRHRVKDLEEENAKLRRKLLVVEEGFTGKVEDCMGGEA